jgi:hypothetical protein
MPRRPPCLHLPGAVLVLVLGACAPHQEGNTVSLPRIQLWEPANRSTALSPDEARRRMTGSVWGVTQATRGWPGWIQTPPVRGSAVAVASDQLLAACEAADNKELVSVARRSSLHLAQVRGVGATGRVCALRVADGGIGAVRTYRPFEDLKVGEPIIAVSSKTSRHYVLSEGTLVVKGTSADPYLETTLTAPTGSKSLALFDAFGNLVGFGAPDDMPGSLLVAFPVPPEAATGLKAAWIGGSPEVQRSLASMGQPTLQPMPITVSP